MVWQGMLRRNMRMYEAERKGLTGGWLYTLSSMRMKNLVLVQPRQCTIAIGVL